MLLAIHPQVYQKDLHQESLFDIAERKLFQHHYALRILRPAEFLKVHLYQRSGSFSLIL